MAPRGSGRLGMAAKKWYEGLKRGDQATHIYHSDKEQLKVITDLIAWMSGEEKLTLVTDQWVSEQDLPSSRILEAASEEGRFEVIPSRQVLAAQAELKTEAMIDAVRAQHQKTADEGADSLIFVWDLGWSSRPPNDLEAFLDYQSKMMITSLPRDLTVMSQCNISALSRQQVERILRVSPLVLEDGQLDRNFWVVSTSALDRPPRGDRLSQRPAERSKVKQS